MASPTSSDIYNKPRNESNEVVFSFMPDKIDFLERFHQGLTAKTLSELKRDKHRDDRLTYAQAILESAKTTGGEFLETYKNNNQKAEQLKESLAILMQKHRINPEDYPQYKDIPDEHILDFIVTVARRDEFLQAAAAVMMYSNRIAKTENLDDHPEHRSKIEKYIRQYGFNNVQDFVEVFGSKPTKENLDIIRNAATTDEEKRKAELALIATTYINRLSPHEDESRANMLAKLGLPQDLPSSVKSINSPIESGMSASIARIVSHNIDFQPTLTN